MGLFNANRDSDDQKEKKGKRLPNQTNLVIRTLVGCYLLYLAYQLHMESDSSMSAGVQWLFIILFAVAGAFFIAHSGYLYFNGIYQGGKADVEEPEEKSEVIDAEPEEKPEVIEAEPEEKPEVIEAEAEENTEAE